MESPSFFTDCVDLDNGSTSYADTFSHGREGSPTSYDQSFAMYNNNSNKMGDGDVPFPVSSRMMEPSKLGMWDTTVTTTELRDPDMGDMVPQQMFVQPRTFLPEHDPLALQSRDPNDNSNDFTPITTPELQPSTRRTSSIKSESRSSAKSTLDDLTDITPPEPSPPKKRKTTRRTKKDAAANLEDDKRNKFLERNRVAASKCREKKKMFVSDLEQTKLDLESQHSRLQLEYNGLLGEVSSLKHTLMTHAKCNDPNIDSWIANEARKFVQTSQLLGKNPYAALDDDSGRGSGPRAGFAHSRNSSMASSTTQYRGGEGSYGSFSCASGTEMPGSGDRRHSIAYSQASPTQTSPNDNLFPLLESPATVTQDTAMNFDHMRDDMFSNDQ